MAEDIASDVLYPEVHKLFSTTQSIGFSVTYSLLITLQAMVLLIEDILGVDEIEARKLYLTDSIAVYYKLK
jgi:hypothetical protein